MEDTYKKNIKRGQIYNISLDNGLGSEQGGDRYAVILQNNIGNYYSPTTIVALITSRKKKNLPTHVDITLAKPSTIMLEQIRTIDKARLRDYKTTLSAEKLKEIDNKLRDCLCL